MAKKTVNLSAVIREVLAADLEMAADEVVKRVREKVPASVAEKSIRENLYSTRSALKRGLGKPLPKPAPSVKKEISPPPPTPVVTSNLAKVTSLVERHGAAVKEVAQAVSDLGGAEKFLAYLEVVVKLQELES